MFAVSPASARYPAATSPHGATSNASARWDIASRRPSAPTTPHSRRMTTARIGVRAASSRTTSSPTRATDASSRGIAIAMRGAHSASIDSRLARRQGLTSSPADSPATTWPPSSRRASADRCRRATRAHRRIRRAVGADGPSRAPLRNRATACELRALHIASLSTCERVCWSPRSPGEKNTRPSRSQQTRRSTPLLLCSSGAVCRLILRAGLQTAHP